MSHRHLQLAIPVSILLQAALLAQTPVSHPRPRQTAHTIAQPPIPNDPLELVTEAQPVQNAEQRQAAVYLMTAARSHWNIRAQPYDLKTSFTTNSGTSGDGTWNLQDTSPGENVYRWTAQGPGYSAINLYMNKMLYSSVPATAVPLRLAQVRTAIFFMFMPFGPQASIRTGTASLNGAELNCVLLNRGPRVPEVSGRGWDEEEYCMDPKLGVLVTYSPVPGQYVLYDYSNAIHFHKQIVPSSFTITEGGQTLIQARVGSVTDPTNVAASLFEPTGLNPVGVGSLMTRPWHVSTFEGNAGSAKSVQVVVVHGMLSPQGTLSDPEILSSSDAGLNIAALDKVATFQHWRTSNEDEPGVTPQSHEVFVTMRFPGK